jgi:DNA-binding GntR family transcriptional regulator
VKNGVAPNPKHILHPKKVADEVASTLRKMILTGDLPPGRVTQQGLAETLGISTMPVREALLRLAAEGFVHVARSRSFEVVAITLQDIRDVYWLHGTLAGELTGRACERWGEAGAIMLRKLEDRYEEAMERGDAAGMEEANWAFHRAINAASEAPKLLLSLQTTLRFIPDGFYGLLSAWPGASQRGHDHIVETFARGNSEAARRTAVQHVVEAGELLIDHFSASGYWTRPQLTTGRPHGLVDTGKATSPCAD